MDLYHNHIGDGSKPHALPIIQGRHADLKCIDATTLVKLIDGCFGDTIDSFTIVDCRYPYEYEGGHIMNSINIYTREGVIREFINGEKRPRLIDDDNVTCFSQPVTSTKSSFPSPQQARYLSPSRKANTRLNSHNEDYLSPSALFSVCDSPTTLPFTQHGTITTSSNIAASSGNDLFCITPTISRDAHNDSLGGEGDQEDRLDNGRGGKSISATRLFAPSTPKRTSNHREAAASFQNYQSILFPAGTPSPKKTFKLSSSPSPNNNNNNNSNKQILSQQATSSSSDRENHPSILYPSSPTSTSMSPPSSSSSSTFHSSATSGASSNKRHVLIFHCEFSSERAPSLLRHLRNKDRDINRNHYPRLMHPELYLLEGGYKAFYGQYRQYCEPQSYRPMGCKEHLEDLRVYKSMNRCRKRLKKC